MCTTSMSVSLAEQYNRESLCAVWAGKVIPVTDRGGPYVCKTSRLPHFLDNRLTDGGDVLSLTRRPASLYTQEDSWYSFLSEA
jgi:hypothetical protein